ncbi:hypothetical protein [Solimicrobium silvestre]|uniref:Phytanoyl-CoA dioxygenase (PhyH) n=1 Tax=Solimicrobium silvestre TaxID=2099400 RepID=A0A2S9H2K7_9BURK|nr:hypothetical protein [Solimicrobium silvestre]PRC94214.1 hypothetical protein S2091_0835 [Solimicrobium silvestre]
MKMINKDFIVSEQDIASFQDRGFLLLKKFFNEDMIAYLQRRTSEQIAAPTDKYQSGFNRLAFDMFEGDQQIDDLLQDPTYRKTVLALTKRNLLFTQSIGFELKKNTSAGFPWHIGTQSFGYHRAEDFGCTIWTPLAPIDTSKQRSGMAYTPKNIISGEFMYNNVDPAVFDCLEKRANSGQKVEMAEFMELRDGPLNAVAMKTLLDYFCVEDDFELGDALIFDKYVIHRSVMLEVGPLELRAAFVMRFVCETSQYDYKRAHSLEIPRKYFGYAGPTKFHLEVCESDGDLIKNSPLFPDREKRLIAA